LYFERISPNHNTFSYIFSVFNQFSHSIDAVKEFLSEAGNKLYQTKGAKNINDRTRSKTGIAIKSLLINVCIKKADSVFLYHFVTE
jgi:hypothetical protein